jgi:DNA-binding MarR family transcriptional regulator
MMKDQDVRRFRTQMKLLQRRLRSEVTPVPGLSRTALQVMGAVERLPAGSQPRQVAEELKMTSSNVAAALRELDEAGFILREKDPGDARRVRLSVTRRGTAVISGLRSERDTWLGRAVEAVLSAEEQRALVAAGQLLQRLAEYEQTPVSW